VQLDNAQVETAVRAACDSRFTKKTCDFPNCGCRMFPGATYAILNALQIEFVLVEQHRTKHDTDLRPVE
jgi:hypothetical protein